VGGSPFSTRLSTLTTGAAEGSMLAAMFSGRHTLGNDDKDGSFFIDRDGTHFAHILNHLRDSSQIVVPENHEVRRALKREAHYYQIGLLEAALHYAPDVVFHKKSAGTFTGQNKGIVAYLTRAKGSIFVGSPSSSDQYLDCKMEDAFAQVVRNYSSGQLSCEINCIGQAFSDCARDFATAQESVPRFGSRTMSHENRMLIMLDFKESLVSYSSFKIQLNDQYENYGAPQMKAMVFPIHEDGTSSSSVSNFINSTQICYGSYVLKFVRSEHENGWARKAFVLLEASRKLASTGFGLLSQPSSLIMGGLELYGILKQNRDTQM